MFSLSPLRRERATTIAIAIVRRAVTLKREPSKKKKKEQKRTQRGLRVITLQEAIKKSPILRKND